MKLFTSSYFNKKYTFKYCIGNNAKIQCQNIFLLVINSIKIAIAFLNFIHTLSVWLVEILPKAAFYIEVTTSFIMNVLSHDTRIRQQCEVVVYLACTRKNPNTIQFTSI